jgi:hypothetical protein
VACTFVCLINGFFRLHQRAADVCIQMSFPLHCKKGE